MVLFFSLECVEMGLFFGVCEMGDAACNFQFVTYPDYFILRSGLVLKICFLLEQSSSPTGFIGCLYNEMMIEWTNMVWDEYEMTLFLAITKGYDYLDS